MFNFFVDPDCKIDRSFYIGEGNHHHIKNVIRLKIGENIIVNCEDCSYLCAIIQIDKDITIAEIIEENYSDNELPVKLFLFQGLPKSDKMELIIQKCTELGVHGIIPTEMSRCISKLEGKKIKAKIERWQTIAESAAKQSKRNVIPEIHEPMSYRNALSFAEGLDMIILPYESKEGMLATRKSLDSIKPGMSVGIFIGPEGGFDDREVASATEKGAQVISLGKRILRTETAAITAVGMLMLYCETKLGGDKID